MNLIDPPGLTVMRIAGGRYRVTAAHKVVWTWMNEFAPVQSSADSESAPAGGVHTLQVGDLVSMTIVDVFESDNQGKLLSYCPTFDNRAVLKTDRTAHAIRLKTGALKKAFKTARNSKLAIAVAAYTSALAQQFRQRVDDAVHNYNSNSSSTKNHHDSPATSHTEAPDHYHEEERKEPLYHYEATHATTTTTNSASARTVSKLQSAAGTSTYMGDDDMERHEV